MVFPGDRTCPRLAVSRDEHTEVNSPERVQMRLEMRLLSEARWPSVAIGLFESAELTLHSVRACTGGFRLQTTSPASGPRSGWLTWHLHEATGLGFVRCVQSSGAHVTRLQEHWLASGLFDAGPRSCPQSERPTRPHDQRLPRRTGRLRSAEGVHSLIVIDQDRTGSASRTSTDGRFALGSCARRDLRLHY